MVPLSVLRDVNFVLFYSCLQYLIALAADAVLPATHATAGFMFLRVQMVWLAVLYLLIFATGVAVGFDSGFVLGDMPTDIKVSETVLPPTSAAGTKPEQNVLPFAGLDALEQPQAPPPTKETSNTTHTAHNSLVALLLLNASILAGHWLLCLFSVLVCASARGDVACAELWGGEYAVVCVVVVGVMQTQLVLSSTLTAVRVSESQGVFASMYYSITLYSLSVFAVAALDATYRGFVPTTDDCGTGDAETSVFCRLLAQQHWITPAQTNMLIYGIAIPVLLDLVLNILYAALGAAERGRWRLTLVVFAAGFSASALWAVGGWYFAVTAAPPLLVAAFLIVWTLRTPSAEAVRKKNA
jgi:hypothetical protein